MTQTLQISFNLQFLGILTSRLFVFLPLYICNFSRIEGIMGHVQTIYDYESLDTNMCLNVNSINSYQGTFEASSNDLKLVYVIFNIWN